MIAGKPALVDVGAFPIRPMRLTPATQVVGPRPPPCPIGTITVETITPETAARRPIPRPTLGGTGGVREAATGEPRPPTPLTTTSKHLYQLSSWSTGLPADKSGTLITYHPLLPSSPPNSGRAGPCLAPQPLSTPSH